MSPLISVFWPHLPTLVSYLYLIALLSKSPFDEPPTYPIEETSFMDDPFKVKHPYILWCVWAQNLIIEWPSILYILDNNSLTFFCCLNTTNIKNSNYPTKNLAFLCQSVIHSYNLTFYLEFVTKVANLMDISFTYAIIFA